MFEQPTRLRRCRRSFRAALSLSLSLLPPKKKESQSRLPTSSPIEGGSPAKRAGVVVGGGEAGARASAADHVACVCGVLRRSAAAARSGASRKSSGARDVWVAPKLASAKPPPPLARRCRHRRRLRRPPPTLLHALTQSRGRPHKTKKANTTTDLLFVFACYPAVVISPYKGSAGRSASPICVSIVGSACSTASAS